MKRFKELRFVSYKEFNKHWIQLNMLIPGVNSGVYTPSLHFSFSIIKQGIFKKRKSVSADITLSINDVIELRDECNLIIAEAERQRRIHREQST